MQVKRITHSETELTLIIVPSAQEMQAMKDHVLQHFRESIKLPGFRDGTAPLALVEKNADQAQLQSQFLEELINQLYPQVVKSENLRPVDRPEITIKKFVPFSTLEIEAKVSVVGEIKLADYKKIKMKPPKVNVTASDVNGVIKSLQQRLAEKKDVDRAAKNGDQVWIDFVGTNSKGESVKGADGKDYPLILGSKTFIPGFEENLVGVKPGDAKTFDLTFPKDYGVKALAGKKVIFNVDVTKVQEILEPKADDTFAAKAGPFKTFQQLKDDVKKQLTIERQREVDMNFQSDLLREITRKSKLTVPNVLTDDQIERMIQELKKNLTYRSQTFQEFLEAEGKSEEEYRQILRPAAEERVKASLVLAEIAEKEKVEVTEPELNERIAILKEQYKDQVMQAELDKPETRRDIGSRLMSEKTIAKLVENSTK